MAQVYIVHGYGAAPEKHWFPWLENELAKIGIVCQRLAMPESGNPSVEKWLQHLEKHLIVNEQTVIVAHSLGCIATLNFLAKNFEKPAGAVFVSGFYQPLETLPELSTFSNLYAVQPPLMPFKSYVVASLDDSVVPHKYSDALAQHLKSDYIRLPQGGHFLDIEGMTEFPLVLELVKKLLHKPY
ncbi:RBBP9/YdeN family alpha/beta hydrolase [Glaesserella sp.]|uniref:RBBP9/YdeN family alpha/beta hydrolase n=1 Tax=Glaesserella sp. TaxID=2094731 RepID=UPI0035A1A761